MNERWRPFRGWPYEVSNLGRVRRSEPGKGGTWVGRILRPVMNASGYSTANLYREGRVRHFSVHRLVLAAFIGPCPSGMETNHRNGVRDDNRLSNLEWTSHSANESHAYRIGLRRGSSSIGSRNGNSKLVEWQVSAIKGMLATGDWTQQRLARIFNISRRTIGDIARGKTWTQVPAVRMGG